MYNSRTAEMLWKKLFIVCQAETERYLADGTPTMSKEVMESLEAEITGT